MHPLGFYANSWSPITHWYCPDRQRHVIRFVLRPPSGCSFVLCFPGRKLELIGLRSRSCVTMRGFRVSDDNICFREHPLLDFVSEVGVFPWLCGHHHPQQHGCSSAAFCVLHRSRDNVLFIVQPVGAGVANSALGLVEF